MKVTHLTLFSALTSEVGATFIDSLRQRHFEWNGDEDIEEVYYPSLFREVKFNAETKSRIIDAVVLVHSTVPRNPENLEFSVGIEFKDTISDLRRDEKYTEYLNVTDYFFFGVPGYLVGNALSKVRGEIDIGVVNLDDGRIIKMPERQIIENNKKQQIFNRIFLKYTQR